MSNKYFRQAITNNVIFVNHIVTYSLLIFQFNPSIDKYLRKIRIGASSRLLSRRIGTFCCRNTVLCENRNGIKFFVEPDILIEAKHLFCVCYIYVLF